jgi:RNA polymerase sigma-70 factor (ECF subfamily)
VLDPDVVGAFDSGGRIPGAPLTLQVGAPTVGITLAHAFAGAGAAFDVIDVNGMPGVTVVLHGRVMAVISLETDGYTIAAIQAIGNPNKLEHLNRRPLI